MTKSSSVFQKNIKLFKSGDFLLSYIWGALIIISLFCAIATGNISELAEGTMQGASDAITLLLTMAGIMCLWSGVMEIGERCGFTSFVSKILSPILSLLFKKLDKNSKAYKSICMNVSANLLGLGNAATPFGLTAMKELNTLNNKNKVASNEMILFVVMNTASIQLLPTMIGTLRQSFGSQAPFEILPCVWISSACALGVALLLALMFNMKK